MARADARLAFFAGMIRTQKSSFRIDIDPIIQNLCYPNTQFECQVMGFLPLDFVPGDLYWRVRDAAPKTRKPLSFHMLLTLTAASQRDHHRSRNGAARVVG